MTTFTFLICWQKSRHPTPYVPSTVLPQVLPQLNLAAFVGNGSILPRFSGNDDRPMPPEKHPVAFQSPPSLEVQVDLPHAGRVSGLAIKQGVTLIVGGGFHGNSTLLEAL